MIERLIQVEVTEPEQRLDQALLQALSREGFQHSRNEVKGWFRENLILYQDHPVKPSFLLKAGHHTLKLPKKSIHQQLTPAHTCFLPIEYEDEDLFILNKASGVPSAPLSFAEENTAVQAALAHFPSLAKVAGFGPKELGLVHRLDTQTSGLLLFAKSNEEWIRLRSCFKTRQIGKFYQAFVELKKPLESLPLEIQLPLTHASAKKMTPHIPNQKKSPSQKAWKAHTVIHSSPVQFRTFAELKVEILTGVTHQIRCHLAGKGWPILGDDLYGGPKSSRLWLHAYRLKIPKKDDSHLDLKVKLTTLPPEF